MDVTRFDFRLQTLLLLLVLLLFLFCKLTELILDKGAVIGNAGDHLKVRNAFFLPGGNEP